MFLQNQLTNSTTHNTILYFAKGSLSQTANGFECGTRGKLQHSQTPALQSLCILRLEPFFHIIWQYVRTNTNKLHIKLYDSIHVSGWVGTPGHVLFVSRLTFFPKSYLALEKYVTVSRKNRGIGGTGQESRKLINSEFSPNGNWVCILVHGCHMHPPTLEF